MATAELHIENKYADCLPALRKHIGYTEQIRVAREKTVQVSSCSLDVPDLIRLRDYLSAAIKVLG